MWDLDILTAIFDLPNIKLLVAKERYFSSLSVVTLAAFE